MSDVFVSYSRKDIAFARILYKDLKAKGMDIWIDWEPRFDTWASDRN